MLTNNMLIEGTVSPSMGCFVAYSLPLIVQFIHLMAVARDNNTLNDCVTAMVCNTIKNEYMHTQHGSKVAMAMITKKSSFV